MAYYYHQADAVALMSLSEGFGLSLIEGMNFGLPSMSFSDIDAYQDIFNPSAMIGVKEHDDAAVAEGLLELMTRKWDKGEIKNYSEKFNSETMSESYNNCYKILIKQ